MSDSSEFVPWFTENHKIGLYNITNQQNNWAVICV